MTTMDVADDVHSTWTAGPELTDIQLRDAMKRANLSAADVAMLLCFRDAPYDNVMQALRVMDKMKVTTAPAAPPNEGQSYINTMLDKLGEFTAAHFALSVYYRCLSKSDQQQVARLLSTCPNNVLEQADRVEQMIKEIIAASTVVVPPIQAETITTTSRRPLDDDDGMEWDLPPSVPMDGNDGNPRDSLDQ